MQKKFINYKFPKKNEDFTEINIFRTDKYDNILEAKLNNILKNNLEIKILTAGSRDLDLLTKTLTLLFQFVQYIIFQINKRKFL